MHWISVAEAIKARSQQHPPRSPMRRQIRAHLRNNHWFRRKPHTSKHSKHNWQTCALLSMESSRMDSTNQSRTSISSSSELEMTLARHGYIAKPEITNVLYLALRLQKPLLLEGPPGAGKTQVAKVLSEALQMPLIRLQCYEGIDEAKALYQWNEPLQRIALEFLSQSSADRSETSWAELKRQLYATDFLTPGPILRALQSDGGAVLLIDEVDKTGPSFEAFLLEVLSDFQVSIPQLGTINARHRPIVL